MNRDTVVYCTCTFLIGLVIGSLVIGPHLAAKATQSTPAANPMGAVREQLAKLQGEVARDPKNAGALIQLGNMYMDAAKYPDAIQYYERALFLRDDPNVRIDLGICYKQSHQLDKALEAFHRAGEQAPSQWQPLYNEAIVLGEMKRFDEARALAAKLKKMRPGDVEVEKLVQALARVK